MQRTFGGERENAILIHRHARVFEYVFRVLAGFQNLDQVAQPSCLPVGLVRLFIGPVCGKAMFGASVHIGTADLHFHPHVFGKHDRGMD